MKLYFISLLLCFCLFKNVLAQTEKSVILAGKPNLQTLQYYDSLDTSPAIYTGTEHRYYSFRIEGDPFFFSDEIAPANIYYNGFLYENIDTYYDIHLQLVIVEHDNMSYAIRLDGEKIQHFSLHNHQFIRLEADSISGMKDGFYDLVVDGDIQFLVYREKELRKEIDNQVIRQWFVPINKYYLLKDGIYHRIKRKGQLLKLLGNRKKELKTFVKRQNISIASFPEDGFKKIITYYNQL